MVIAKEWTCRARRRASGCFRSIDDRHLSNDFLQSCLDPAVEGLLTAVAVGEKEGIKRALDLSTRDRFMSRITFLNLQTHASLKKEVCNFLTWRKFYMCN